MVKEILHLFKTYLISFQTFHFDDIKIYIFYLNVIFIIYFFYNLIIFI